MEKGPPGVCFGRLLPEGAFGGDEPDLEKACTGKKAYPTALIVKTAVVAGAGPMQVTPAMREWSRMGWYETAAFAAMRAHCCSDAPPLETPERYAKCEMEASLAHIAESLDDREAMDAALEEFRRAAICTAQKGGGGAFGRFGLPSKVELKQVDNVLDRIDADRSR